MAVQVDTIEVMPVSARHFQFGLRQLFQAVACFAVAFGCIALPMRYDIPNIETRQFCRFYCNWMAAMAVGGGIGVFVRRFEEGIVVASFLLLIVLVLVQMWAGTFPRV